MEAGGRMMEMLASVASWSTTDDNSITVVALSQKTFSSVASNGIDLA